MIAAILAVCLQANPAQCVSQQFRVEPAACRVRPYRAEAPLDGEWRAVIVTLKCRAVERHS